MKLETERVKLLSDETEDYILDKTVYCITGMHHSCRGGAWSGSEYIVCKCDCHNKKRGD
jgi:hypothetical protein